MKDEVDIAGLLLPSRTDGPWTLEVDRALCLGAAEGKHLSGGAALSVCVHQLEAELGLPVISSHARFMASPGAGSEISVHIDVIAAGRSISQAIATLACNDEVQTVVTATLGSRKDLGEFSWDDAPAVRSPDRCEPLVFVRDDPGDLHGHLDIRRASDEREAKMGRLAFWVRLSDGADPIDARLLALVADYVPEAIHHAMGRPAGAISLDNVFRVVRRVPTEWVLCATQIQGISAGLFHGRMNLFSQNGELLATANQSGIVRLL